MRQTFHLLVNFGFVYNDGVGCAACGRERNGRLRLKFLDWSSVVSQTLTV